MKTRKTEVKNTKKYAKGKRQKGITLVALVITIIVLLILAGVGINMAISSDGLFAKANQAVTEYNKGVAKEQEAIENILQQANEITGGSTTPPFNENDITIDEADAQRTGDYGKQVEGYQSAGEGLGDKEWRLFYQDSKYTYLIMDELGEEVSLYTKYNEEPEKYKEGATVSTIGKKLNKGLLDTNKDEFFTYTTEKANTNVLGIKWLTDTENWEKYKDVAGNAEYAIGAPTGDLFAASYNSNTNAEHTSKYKKGAIVLTPNKQGYTHNTTQGDWFNTADSYGIYNKTGEDKSWWLASAHTSGNNYMLGVNKLGSCFRDNNVENTYALRPVVCIQTPVFERGIKNGTYKLTDDE